MPAKYGVLGVRRQERRVKSEEIGMRTPRLARAAVPIPVDVLAAEAEVLCTGCDAVLDIHQPDTECPDRFLGTCPECGAWFLIDDQVHLMIPVPDLRLIGIIKEIDPGLLRG